MSNLKNIRQRYAEKLRDKARLQLGLEMSEALVGAFAKVSREHFLGPGPWPILKPHKTIWERLARRPHSAYRTSPDDNPKHLYRDVLVGIDVDRGLNNGQPSGLALWLHFLDLREGDRVLHVGCGVGYYTAIIAEVVGTTGQIVAIEIDPDLASRAGKNLAHLRQVEVVHGDGGEYDAGPCDSIFINAGVTHPKSVWLDGLKPGGRMIIPVTQESGEGGILKVDREPSGYAARFIFLARIFHCVGGRDEELSLRLRERFADDDWRSVQSLRREPHEPDRTCWLHGDGFCLSLRT